MTRKQSLRLAAVVLLAAWAALAHHADPLYDMKHPITVTGVVSRVEWSNPHVYLYLNITNEKGGTEEWSIELSAPHSLQHDGWTSTTVKPGDRITCTGGRAKSGGRALRRAPVRLADGKKLKSERLRCRAGFRSTASFHPPALACNRLILLSLAIGVRTASPYLR